MDRKNPPPPNEASGIPRDRKEDERDRNLEARATLGTPDGLGRGGMKEPRALARLLGLVEFLREPARVEHPRGRGGYLQAASLQSSPGGELRPLLFG